MKSLGSHELFSTWYHFISYLDGSNWYYQEGSKGQQLISLKTKSNIGPWMGQLKQTIKKSISDIQESFFLMNLHAGKPDVDEAENSNWLNIQLVNFMVQYKFAPTCHWFSSPDNAFSFTDKSA